MKKKFDLISKEILTVCVVAIFGLSTNLSYNIGKQEEKRNVREYVSAAYELGQEKAAGYSEEYLEAYGVFMYAFGSVDMPQETAKEWAVNQCNLFVRDRP